MDSVVVVAFSDIGPIDHHGASVGGLGKVQTSKPRVLPKDHIRPMGCQKPCPGGVDEIAVDPTAMEVQSIDVAMVLLGPLVGLVDHQPAVGMTTASRIGSTARRAFASLSPVFGALVPMDVVGDLRKKLIDIGVRVLPVHTLQVSVGDRVPKMTDDGVDKE